jgi:hypothetical protein
VRTDDHPRQYGRIGANRCALLHNRSGETLRVLPASRELVIGKSGIWANKDVIFEMHTIPELNPTFNRDPISNDDIIFYKHMVAHIAFIPDYGTGKNIYECPDTRPMTYLVCLHQGSIVLEKLFHEIVPKIQAVTRRHYQ